jgi:tetratricopeptide (TPR) repeat protein
VFIFVCRIIIKIHSQHYIFSIYKRHLSLLVFHIMAVRSSSTDPSSGSSWQSHRDRGKAAFAAGDYETSLEEFRAALSNSSILVSALDRQLLLSNVVACRLKLGGRAQAEAAVNDAKACVAINPAWSKGHVRLASAYVALGPQHSNDACNALQTALRHDPGNGVARQMLLQELRRDHAHRHRNSNHSNINSSTDSATTRTSSDTNLEPEDDEPGDSRPPRENPNYVAPPSEGTSPTNPLPPEGRGRDPELFDEANDVTLTDRLNFYMQRWKFWYEQLTEDARTAIHILLGLVVLYVAFGGRFGLGGSCGNRRQPRGQYGPGNPYERQRQTTATGRSDSWQSNSYGYPSSRSDDAYATGYGSYQHHQSSSDAGAGLLYLALTGAAMYAAHWLGISPWQVLLMLRVLGGGGRGFMYGGGGGLGGRRRGMHFGRRRW